MNQKDDSKRRLLEDAGAAHAALLHCPNCRSVLASNHQPHPIFHWGLILSCGKCGTRWVVCTLCNQIRKHMLENSSAAQRHHKMKHGGTSKTMQMQSLPISIQHPGQPNEQDKPGVSFSENPPERFHPELFSRPENSRFFEHQAKGHDGVGYLVGLSNFGKDNISKMLNPEDVDMFVSLAHYCSTQTRPQREQLAEVLKKATLATHRQALSNSTDQRLLASPMKSPAKPNKKPIPKQYTIKVPTSIEEIRSRIIEGKNSFFGNLPHPAIQVMDDYAYILPSDCLRDLFAHGHLFRGRTSAYPPICGLADCQLAQQITTGPEYLASTVDKGCRLSISLWSDDFEPNYSKLNRGSVWIKTITFHIPGRSHVPITSVYPIAVGPKGLSHDAIETVLYQDIQSLAVRGNSGGIKVYDGYNNCLRMVSAELISVMQDQPERRRANRLMLGNSTYHARFGTRMDYSQVVDSMRACSQCEHQMVQSLGNNQWTPPSCSECTNWAVNPSHPLLVFVVPDNYPSNSETEAGQAVRLASKELDFPYLKTVVRMAHDNLVNRVWSKASTEQYLRVNCFNSSAVREIVTCAENCYSWKNAEAENNEEIMSILEEEKEREPHKHQMWKWPTLWDNENFQIWQSVEVPMHLLFKGVVETTTSVIQGWITKQRKYESFVRYMKEKMLSLRDLHLSWLKAEPYTRGELGGWVSENFLALARVYTWVYSGLFFIAADPEYIPPDKPQNKWTKVENQKWLSVRKLNIDGNAAVLRERVAMLMASEDGPPPIPPPSGGSIAKVSHVVIRLQCMISFLMGTDGNDMTTDDSSISSLLIRLFLNAVFDIDVAMRADNDQSNKKPIWLSSYNFMSLLNLPKQVSNLGPVRNRWEGGVSGEGFLRTVKPTLTSPNRLNWTKNLLTTLVRQRSILSLRRSMKEESDVDGDEHWLHRDSKFRTYTSLTEIEDALAELRPISVVVVETEEPIDVEQGDYMVGFELPKAKLIPKHFVVYREGNLKRMLELEYGAPWTFVLGMHYCNWRLADEPVAFPHGDDATLTITSYAVLLPMVEGVKDFSVENSEDRQYTVVDHRWRTSGSDGVLLFPHTAMTRASTGVGDDGTLDSD